MGRMKNCLNFIKWFQIFIYCEFWVELQLILENGPIQPLVILMVNLFYQWYKDGKNKSIENNYQFVGYSS